MSVAWPTGVQLVFFLFLRSKSVIRRPGISTVGQLTESVESPFFFFFFFFFYSSGLSVCS